MYELYFCEDECITMKDEIESIHYKLESYILLWNQAFEFYVQVKRKNGVFSLAYTRKCSVRYDHVYFKLITHRITFFIWHSDNS